MSVREITSNKPLVSAMMPVFNGADHLELSIRSVLNQTYQNFELIIVDDGSTDGTASLLKRLKSIDDRIKVISLPHQGRGGARNVCLENCAGDFIAICDADDVSFSTRFEKQVAVFLQDQELDVLGSGFIAFVGDEQPFDWIANIRVETDSKLIRKAFFSGRMKVHNATAMIRRSCFSKVGLYDVRMRRAQDFEFFVRLNSAGGKFQSLPEPLLFYRQSSRFVSLRYFIESGLYIIFAKRRINSSDSFTKFQNSIFGRFSAWYLFVKYFYLCAKIILQVNNKYVFPGLYFEWTKAVSSTVLEGR